MRKRRPPPILGVEVSGGVGRGLQMRGAENLESEKSEKRETPPYPYIKSLYIIYRGVGRRG